MGLILKKYIDDDCLFGLWEINEDYDTLMAQVKLDHHELKRLESFQNHPRKLEWLSVRALVNTLLNRDVKIVYNEMRKPFLHDDSYKISISHSKDYTSVLLSSTKQVGLDLEYMSHKIARLHEKFVNENEQITTDPALRNFHLYIHWCAKEALYKICDKQDINFKTNLTIKPFTPEKEGQIKGVVENQVLGHEEFDINYFELNNYVVAWCNKGQW